jgi:protein SCO1
VSVNVTLRRLLLVGLVVAAGAGAYGLGLALRPPPALAGTELGTPPRVVDLDLVRGDGTPVRLDEVAGGRPMLLFFGFTRCPDVCPLTMAHLARIYDAEGAPADLVVAMITVDPEFDTPEVLDRYVRAFHPDFIALSGSNAQIAVAARTFYIGFTEVSGPQRVHTDVVAVVDRSGRLRYIYGQDALRRLQADLPTLRRRL